MSELDTHNSLGGPTPPPTRSERLRARQLGRSPTEPSPSVTEPALTPGIPLTGLERALGLCGKLRERAALLKPTWTVPADPVDRIVLATMGRCETTFRVVLTLIAQGDSPHATAFARMMGEDCEVAHWLVAKRPGNVVELSNDYWDWQNLRLNGDDDAGAVGIPEERAADLRQSFKNPGAHWTRQNTKSRRRDICEWCTDATRLEALEHLFLNVDVWANAMLHHSPWGLGAAVSPRATVEQPRFTTAPSWLHSWAALRFSYLSSSLLLNLCDETYGKSRAKRSASTFHEFFGDEGVQLLDETKSLHQQEQRRAAHLANKSEKR